MKGEWNGYDCGVFVCQNAEKIARGTFEKQDQIQHGKSMVRGESGKPRIKWPKANSKEWAKIDEDLTALLKILYSPPEKLAESHPKNHL